LIGLVCRAESQSDASYSAASGAFNRQRRMPPPRFGGSGIRRSSAFTLATRYEARQQRAVTRSCGYSAVRLLAETRPAVSPFPSAQNQICCSQHGGRRCCAITAGGRNGPVSSGRAALAQVRNKRTRILSRARNAVVKALRIVVTGSANSQIAKGLSPCLTKGFRFALSERMHLVRRSIKWFGPADPRLGAAKRHHVFQKHSNLSRIRGMPATRFCRILQTNPCLWGRHQ